MNDDDDMTASRAASRAQNWQTYIDYMEFLDDLDENGGKEGGQEAGKLGGGAVSQTMKTDSGQSILVKTHFDVDVVSFTNASSSSIDDAARPFLSPPIENPSAKAPYSLASQQRLINEYFAQHLLTALSKQHDITGNEVQNIYDFVMKGGPAIKDPHLLSISQQAQAIATSETRAAWKLPPSWQLHTHDIASLIPLPGEIDPSVVTPLQMSKAISKDTLEALFSNSQEVLKACLQHADQAAAMTGPSKQQAGKTPTTNNLTPDEAATQYRNYLVTIAGVLAKLKEQLLSMEITDAKKATTWKQAELTNNQQRTQMANDLFSKMMEVDSQNADLKAKQQTAKNWSLAIAILGPIITAIAGIVTVATCGATGPVLALVIAVQVAAVTFAVVDSCTNLTSTLVNDFNNAIDSDLSSSPPWVKDLVKAVIIIAIVAVLIITALLTGGGTLADAAEMLGTDAVKAAAKTLAREALLQAAITTLMAGGAVTDIVLSIAEASGPVSPEAKQEIQMIVAIVEAVAMILGTLFMSGGGTKSADEIAAAATAETRATAGRLQRIINYLTENVMQALTNAKNMPRDLLKYLISDAKEWKAIAQKCALILEFGGKFIPSVANGVIYSQMSGIKKQLAKIIAEEAIPQSQLQLLSALQQMVDEVLQNLNTGMQTTAQELSAITQEVNAMFQAQSQSTSKLFNANSPMAG